MSGVTVMSSIMSYQVSVTDVKSGNPCQISVTISVSVSSKYYKSINTDIHIQAE